MTDERPRLHTGGCQCGAVRFALFAEPFNTHVCHCRMCQKASGGAFSVSTNIKLADFAWTRGRPATFESSAGVERGFCGACGTTLSYYADGSDDIDLSIGSFDKPATLVPHEQIGMEGRLPWTADLSRLDAKTTANVIPADILAGIESRQHPDHDTDEWPPKG